MKRIAIIAHGLGDGGAERVASLLANHYHSIGMKVLFIAIYHAKREYSIHPEIEYRYVDVHGKRGFFALWQRSVCALRLVKEFKADAVVSFVEHEIMLLTLSGADIISSLRNDPKSTERGLFLKKLRNFNYSNSKKIVFQTEGAKNYFSERIQRKGVIIRNPLKEGLPYWNEADHEKVFITACRLSTQKNIPMLIKAFAAFYPTHKEYSLEIYGNGSDEYKKQFGILAAELGVGEVVHFKGNSAEIHKHMCRAEAFVLSSNYEGLSNSMLEAMAIGVPCICTDCPPGGARDVMAARGAGILVPVGDVAAFTSAMQKVAGSSELRIRLSENEKYIREELRPEKIYKQWVDVLGK